jgi:hypothetical protein
MNSEQALVDSFLDRAIAEFHTNPLSTQLMRRLARERTALFTISALRHLEADEHSGALRFLSVLLLQQGNLLERIADPIRSSRQKSVNLFRRLIAIDCSFDVKLARMLPDRSGLNHSEAFKGAQAARALDILDETSEGRRLLPVLGHLVDSNDSSTSATATLFVGHRLKSPAWAAKQLERPDQRIRANAIESIWGLDSNDAKALLAQCVSDPCNRVAGNSLVGLHMAGIPGIVEEIETMAGASKPEFRATAAWSMGRMNDPLFVPFLTALVRDEHDKVRSAALRALVGIRREEARAAEEAASRITKMAEEPIAPAEEFVIDPAPVEEEEIEYAMPSFDLRLDGSSFSWKPGA